MNDSKSESEMVRETTRRARVCYVCMCVCVCVCVCKSLNVLLCGTCARAGVDTGEAMQRDREGGLVGTEG